MDIYPPVITEAQEWNTQPRSAEIQSTQQFLYFYVAHMEKKQPVTCQIWCELRAAGWQSAHAGSTSIIHTPSLEGRSEHVLKCTGLYDSHQRIIAVSVDCYSNYNVMIM